MTHNRTIMYPTFYQLHRQDPNGRWHHVGDHPSGAAATDAARRKFPTPTRIVILKTVETIIADFTT